MENNPAILFEQSREKTRVLITGSATGIADLIVQSLIFCGKKVDYITYSNSDITGNDFLILENKNTSEVVNFHPNVVFIASEDSSEDFSDLLKNIVGGGILIYNKADENLLNTINASQNYFRKLPYSKLITQGNTFKTEYGDMPLPSQNQEINEHIEGARLLCQQLGIMEEEFYESLMSY